MSLRVLEVEKEGRQIRVSLPYKTVVRLDMYKQYYRDTYNYPIEDKELVELMTEETLTEDKKFLVWEKDNPHVKEQVEKRLDAEAGRRQRRKPTATDSEK